jgi:hypothetical protein
MADLVFVDEPDDPYIHPLVDQINDLSIDESHVYELDEFGNPVTDYRYSVMSIDIGIQHLGISIGITDEAYNLIEIEWVQLIDITKYTHEHDLLGVECHVDHQSRAFADWLRHLFLEYDTLFSGVDHILVERQPPAGLVVIEQLILFQWRHKCQLIAPRSMHSYFGIGSTVIDPGDQGYEQRKRMTQLIAEKNSDWHPRALIEYAQLSRKHDVADSICLMLFWLSKKKAKYVREENRRRCENLPMPGIDGMTIGKWFEQMRYDPCNRPRKKAKPDVQPDSGVAVAQCTPPV